MAGDYVADCMARHGYVEDASERDCEPQNELNAYCYAPRGRLAFLAYKAELLVQPQ
jgi:hypothetical protein